MNEVLNSDWETLIYILERAGMPIAEMKIWREFGLISSYDARKLLQSLPFLSKNEIHTLHGFLKQKNDLLKSGDLEKIQSLVDAECMFVENENI